MDLSLFVLNINKLVKYYLWSGVKIKQPKIPPFSYELNLMLYSSQMLDPKLFYINEIKYNK